MALEYAVEDEPLGTGGGIGFAGRQLDRRFFALNGDWLREADLDAMVEFHRSTGGKATIMLTPVPTRAGTGSCAPPRTVGSRVPREAAAGGDRRRPRQRRALWLEPEGSARSPGRAVSIEREAFPTLSKEGSVFGISPPGYWLDVGTPESYLQAHRDVLERICPTEVGEALGSGYTLVDDTAHVHPDARLVAAGLRRPRRGARGGARPEASRCSERVRGWRRGASSRARSSARGPHGAGATVVGSSSATTPSWCRLRPPQAGGRRAWREVGHGTSSTTACASAPAAHPRRGACASREPRGRRAAEGRQAVGLGARVGRGGGLRRQAPVRPGRRVAESAVPRGEGRVVARAGGPRAPRARRGGGALETVEIAKGTPSASGRARCTASRRSRTRWSSRSRRSTSPTSSGSRTGTVARERDDPSAARPRSRVDRNRNHHERDAHDLERRSGSARARGLRRRRGGGWEQGDHERVGRARSRRDIASWSKTYGMTDEARADTDPGRDRDRIGECRQRAPAGDRRCDDRREDHREREAVEAPERRACAQGGARARCTPRRGAALANANARPTGSPSSSDVRQHVDAGDRDAECRGIATPSRAEGRERDHRQELDRRHGAQRKAVDRDVEARVHPREDDRERHDRPRVAR